MKAAVFHGKESVTVDELPIPKVGARQVLIKVRACGVCGTDIHIFDGAKGAAECVPPTVLGHEFAGEIVELGEGVEGWAIGDRVAVDPNNICGECHYCLSGKAHFCENMIGTGTSSDGGFAEYCAVHTRQLNMLAPELSFEEGAMAEPVSCCLHGMDLTEVEQGDNVLIVGGGAIGQIMLRLCVLAGAGGIVMLDHHQNKLDLALKSGATLALDSRVPENEELIKSSFPRGFDKVIECVGNIPSIEEALGWCGNKATLMIFGLAAPDEEMSIKPYEIFAKEISIKASYINPYTIGRSVNLLNSGRLKVDDLIETRIPLADAQKVFTDRSYIKKGKVVILP